MWRQDPHDDKQTLRSCWISKSWRHFVLWFVFSEGFLLFLGPDSPNSSIIVVSQLLLLLAFSPQDKAKLSCTQRLTLESIWGWMHDDRLKTRSLRRTKSAVNCEAFTLTFFNNWPKYDAFACWFNAVHSALLFPTLLNLPLPNQQRLYFTGKFTLPSKKCALVLSIKSVKSEWGFSTRYRTYITTNAMHFCGWFNSNWSYRRSSS